MGTVTVLEMLLKNGNLKIFCMLYLCSHLRKLTFLFFVTTISSCVDKNYKELDFKTFKIIVPNYWKEAKSPKKDGHHGEIKITEKKIIEYFAGNFAYCLTPDSTIHTESKISIDGKEGYLIRPKAPGKGMHMLSIYRLGKNKESGFLLVANNLNKKEEEEFLEAIRTIEIEDIIGEN
jgi:hypothetical protein